MHTLRVHSFSFNAMHQAKLSDLIGIINKIAHPTLAEEWDNCGLQIGDPAVKVDRIMVSLDPSPVAVAEAIRHSCQLLVTHHPLIFSPVKRISATDPTGALIYRAINNGLAIASLHTNYDIAVGGVNDLLATALDLEDTRPLKVTTKDELLKFVIFVPESHEESLLESLLPYSASQGNYGECSFRVQGVGTYRPLAGSTPFIGKIGSRESVTESRIEILLQASDLKPVLKVIRNYHPYEEPAFDIIPLRNTGVDLGLGRIGELREPILFEDYCELVKSRLELSCLRIAGARCSKVSRVALCGGSGASLMRDAARQGAELFVTGDLKYHDAREAEELGITVIDAGHFATERLMINGLSLQLRHELAARKMEAEVIPCLAEKEPFTNL